MLTSLCFQNQNQLQETGRVQLWILLLDLLVLTSWQILDPLRREVLQHRMEVRSLRSGSGPVRFWPGPEALEGLDVFRRLKLFNLKTEKQENLVLFIHL